MAHFLQQNNLQKHTLFPNLDFTQMVQTAFFIIIIIITIIIHHELTFYPSLRAPIVSYHFEQEMSITWSH